MNPFAQVDVPSFLALPVSHGASPKLKESLAKKIKTKKRSQSDLLPVDRYNQF